MAFTTISGGSLADKILIGSAAADTVVLNTAETFVVNGEADGDTITIANPAFTSGGIETRSTTSSTIYGADGNDVFRLANLTIANSSVEANAGNDTIAPARNTGLGLFEFASSYVNGNEGDDTIGADGGAGVRASSSQILGGANNDTIWIGTSENTEFNGNKNADLITVQNNSIITGGSIFGGKGADTIRLQTATFDGTSITGADGIDVILATALTTAADSNVNVSGGIDGDTITISAATLGARSTLTVSGDDGNDIITTGNVTSVFGGEGSDTISIAAAAAYTVDGGAGVDTINLGGAGSGNAIYTLASIASVTGLSAATIDSVTGFAGTDNLVTGLAATAENFTAAAGQATYNAALEAANGVFGAVATGDQRFVYVENTAATSPATDGWLFFKSSAIAGAASGAIYLDGTVLTAANAAEFIIA